MLDRNPLDGLPYPKNDSPRRPVLTAEEYDAVRAVAPQVHAQFALAVVLAHATGHRLASIRLLRWSDVDLEARRVRWRADSDKQGYEHITPLNDEAVAALTQAKRERPAIGDAWILPSLRDASKPAQRSTMAKWWRRAETLAKIERIPGRGWHSFRRTFASELRHVPLKDLCDMGGWKSADTVLTCYVAPDEAAQRAAMETRRTLRKAGIS
jgi:integrase